MADTDTSQTQSAAQTTHPAVPAGASTTPVSTDVDSLIDAAFEDEPTETPPGNRVQPPATDTPDPDAAPEGDPPEEQPEEEEEVDPNGDPEELTTESELEVPKGLENEPKWIQKRFKKFAEVNRKLREENAAKSQPQITLTPSPQNPWSDVQTVSDLDTRYVEAKRLKAFCEANPEGYFQTKGGREYEITAEDVKARPVSYTHLRAHETEL
jgi:hypothetical protein